VLVCLSTPSFVCRSLDQVLCSVTLSKHWRFSALYPSVKGHAFDAPGGVSAEPSAQWTVVAQPSGELQDVSTKRVLSYLFWEAKTGSLVLVLVVLCLCGGVCACAHFSLFAVRW
jgi:hypothetical protein